MKFNELTKLKGITRGKKRLGRGVGSGKGGHTVGKGTKGQKARAGSHKPWAGFEGGQVPLYKRLPRMNGFKNVNSKVVLPISLDTLNKFSDGDVVTPKLLISKNLVNSAKSTEFKILNNGSLNKKVSLKGFKISASALKAIEKAGAKVIQ